MEQSIILIVIIMVIIVVIVKIKKELPNIDNEAQVLNNSNQRIYQQKSLLTNSERCFYSKLIDLEPQYKVIPQVNLSCIIEKTADTKYHTELFRNIDYGIFTSDLSKILLLIELNDQSHNQAQRRKRDIKVREICKIANIPLITFYTNYPNEKNYVLNRVLTEIKKSEDNAVDVHSSVQNVQPTTVSNYNAQPSIEVINHESNDN